MKKTKIIGVVLMLVTVGVLTGCLSDDFPFKEEIEVKTFEGKIYDLRDRKSYTVVYFKTGISYEGLAIAFSNLPIDDYLQLEYYLLKNSTVCVTYSLHTVVDLNLSFNKFISVNEVKPYS